MSRAVEIICRNVYVAYVFIYIFMCVHVNTHGLTLLDKARATCKWERQA